MALKDHYCIEDYGMMADHLEKLLKTCLHIQECAANANFIHNDQHLQEINQSLKALKALNIKKTERDRVNEESVIRRNWF